nr:MAG TPA: hypothetical protein [Caudoviricetes sp.]
MDASHISAITPRQLEGVARAATAHCAVELLNITTVGRRIHIEAISDDGHTTFGEWHLELRDRTMFLRIVVAGTLYMEILEEALPLHWDRTMEGLRLWGKAVNAVELRSALSSQP